MYVFRHIGRIAREKSSDRREKAAAKRTIRRMSSRKATNPSYSPLWALTRSPIKVIRSGEILSHT